MVGCTATRCNVTSHFGACHAHSHRHVQNNNPDRVLSNMGCVSHTIPEHSTEGFPLSAGLSPRWGRSGAMYLFGDGRGRQEGSQKRCHRDGHHLKKRALSTTRCISSLSPVKTRPLGRTEPSASRSLFVHIFWRRSGMAGQGKLKGRMLVRLLVGSFWRKAPSQARRNNEKEGATVRRMDCVDVVCGVLVCAIT